ncbi:MAG: DUF1622 domain-containing protein [Ignavibacteria bacterium]|nr:DUF1622 domain-containing protein [Ignavibacteria bacterium]
MEDIFYKIAQGVEAVSFTIMIYGAVLAIAMLLKNEFGRFTGRFRMNVLNKIRLDFGYYILLGLEFLVAADIIETILKPTTEELIELGGIVAIRIILSFFLTKELNELKRKERSDESTIKKETI